MPHPPSEPPAPLAPRPQTRTAHGREFVDDFAWLRADNWREVLRDPAALPADIRAAIEAENRYAAAALAPHEELRRTLVAEMRGRIQEDDAEPPSPDGLYLYYTRYDEGSQHPIFCRAQTDGAHGETLLDANVEARGKPFFDLAHARHSPDHRKFGWSVDEKGSELNAIRMRDLASGEDGGDVVADSDGSFVFTADSRQFYYVRVDANNRPSSVLRHRIGADPATDETVFEEADPRWFIALRPSQSNEFSILTLCDHDATECWLIDLADPGATPRLVEPRAPGRRYDVEPARGRLFVVTNADGAEDFKIVSAPLETPGKARWTDEVPAKPGRMVIEIAAFPDYLVWLEREHALPRIIVRHLESGEDHAIAFEEEAFSLAIHSRFAFETRTLRFTYSSMTTPRETYDYDLSTRVRVLRKRQAIPSGHDPSLYVTRRLEAPAPDGEAVPVSLAHRRDLDLASGPPLLLYGYGAYGHSTSASFSASRLCLLDRGFVFAIAHVRGGTEKGWRWYVGGKLADKPNSFSDFVAAGEYLAEQGYTRPGRIVSQGGSAGGLLVGAALNLAPSLFAGVIADVPFVDVLNTMLDAELPLTPPEWLEWGDPISNEDAFLRLRAYSPCEALKATRYPPVLALAGVTDPRVTYWEPLKWIARMRARMTGGGPVMCRTNMGAGHGGAPGRFDRLEETALQYAFAVACASGAFAQDSGARDQRRDAAQDR